MSLKFKDAKKVKQFNIETQKKGFTSSYVEGDNIINEYFQFKEIYQIIHFPGRGVEIVNFDTSRRVFYNDEDGKSQILFDALNTAMLSWMQSNLN
jgi:hypothetical protein